MIDRLSHRDALTDLPDRCAASEKIVEQQAQSRRSGYYFGLISIDLNEFKKVNYQFGFGVGDRLLVDVSERLAACLPGEGTLSRMGGDEFLVILTRMGADRISAVQQIELLSRKLLTALSLPYQLKIGSLGECSLNQDISIAGCASAMVMQGNGASLDEVMMRLDWALHLAKAKGANTFMFYGEIEHASILAFHSLQDALANALARGELFLRFQPIVDRQQEIIGMEALMRWNSPEYGQIPPSQFVPIAERSGAIVDMGAWALEESCKQLEQWAKSPKSSKWTLSVNISVHQFNSSCFFDEVLRLVEKYAIEPGRLILEVTENVFFNSTGNRHQSEFKRIRSAGVGIAIDDFGTGFSSMCYLRNLSVSRIKIDKTFINDVVVSKKDQGIVKAMIMLAQALGVDIVAEGVETAEQFKYLKNVGCSAFQGFFFGRPSDVSQFL
ncbi:bifunctional diguanylate cyclase/phosphodiesterase [Pollutimonas bauzanensis]|uniref:putative bifunctional diguanylate cyclase/phosphodiesterase n=1 Tax=Pollutimonas bauzanensis TaxID=658167 RepID=UPI00333FDE7F